MKFAQFSRVGQKIGHICTNLSTVLASIQVFQEARKAAGPGPSVCSLLRSFRVRGGVGVDAPAVTICIDTFARSDRVPSHPHVFTFRTKKEMIQ